MKIDNCMILTYVPLLYEHNVLWSTEHCLKVRKSSSHRAPVLLPVDPKFTTVASSVIFVPPIRESQILAKNSNNVMIIIIIIDCNKNKFKL